MQLNQIAVGTLNVAILPAKLAVRVASVVVRRGAEEARTQREPEREARRRQEDRAPGPDPQRDIAPKPLDDVTLSRKVESVIFRDRKVAKGKVDVNAVDGVIWLRGEAKTPELINELERRARSIPEVRRVENLLHLPKTPAPSRTDTPASQRKTRRSPRRQGQRKVQVGKVTAERRVSGAEPSPKEVTRRRSGRKPAPLDG